MADVTAITLSRRVQMAYLSVFGAEGTRTGDQQLVMRDLETFAYAYRLVSEGVTGGEIAANRALFNDGRRSVWLRIRGQVIKAGIEPKRITVSRQKKIQPQ